MLLLLMLLLLLLSSLFLLLVVVVIGGCCCCRMLRIWEQSTRFEMPLLFGPWSFCSTPNPVVPRPPEKKRSKSLQDWNLNFEDLPPAAEEEECAICLSPLTQNCARTLCGHRFHVVCLEANFAVTKRATCPLCRGSLRGPVAVTARSTSGRPIEVLSSVPERGDRLHFDRDYRFVTLGDFVHKPQMLYVLTSNEDKKTSSSAVMWVLD
ncbi:unnamed protein product, partial [Polarella glacialis]